MAGCRLLPQNCPFPQRESDPPLNTWFFEPTQVYNPSGISIGSSVSAELPKNCPFPCGIRAPTQHMAHLRPHHKRHLERFSRLSTAHDYLNQTDTETQQVKFNLIMLVTIIDRQYYSC